MSAIVIVDQVRIPANVRDLDSFRRWARSEDFPREGRFSYLRDELWVDYSMVELITHNLVKAEITMVLGALVKREKRGYFFVDGALLTNVKASLSTEPDGMFVSYTSLKQGKAKLVQGKKGRSVELEGTPDMVLEVVSETSVRKDCEVLRDLYWRAQIPEYWLVDAQSASIRFEILRHGARGYTASRPKDEWTKSPVFGKAFSLQTTKDQLGNALCDLQIS